MGAPGGGVWGWGGWGVLWGGGKKKATEDVRDDRPFSFPTLEAIEFLSFCVGSTPGTQQKMTPRKRHLDSLDKG